MTGLAFPEPDDADIARFFAEHDDIARLDGDDNGTFAHTADTLTAAPPHDRDAIIENFAWGWNHRASQGEAS